MKSHEIKIGGVYRTTNGKYVTITDIAHELVTYCVIRAKKRSIRSQPGQEYTVKFSTFMSNFLGPINFELGKLQIW